MAHLVVASSLSKMGNTESEQLRQAGGTSHHPTVPILAAGTITLNAKQIKSHKIICLRHLVDDVLNVCTIFPSSLQCLLQTLPQCNEHGVAVLGSSKRFTACLGV